MSEYFTVPADIIAGTRIRSAKINAIIQAIEDGFDELPAGLVATTEEIVAARDGESTLLAQIDALQAAILAVTSANGSLVSVNDTTPGFLNGKALAGSGITLTENNDGGNETLTWSTPVFTTVDKTTTGNLSATEVNGYYTITNDGAGAEVILTWPALVTGQKATFYVNDAQYLQIKAPAATTIRIGSATTAAAGYIRANTVGNFVTVTAMPDGLVVSDYLGTWNYDQ